VDECGKKSRSHKEILQHIPRQSAAPFCYGEEIRGRWPGLTKRRDFTSQKNSRRSQESLRLGNGDRRGLSGMGRANSKPKMGKQPAIWRNFSERSHNLPMVRTSCWTGRRIKNEFWSSEQAKRRMTFSNTTGSSRQNPFTGVCPCSITTLDGPTRVYVRNRPQF